MTSVAFCLRHNARISSGRSAFLPLNLYEFTHQRPSAAIEVIPDSLLLGLQAKPATTSPIGADSKISNEATSGSSRLIPSIRGISFLSMP